MALNERKIAFIGAGHITNIIGDVRAERALQMQFLPKHPLLLIQYTQ